MRIFISYAHVDWQFVDKLANRLRRYHDVWFDEHLHAGQEWWQTILAQLNWCECFVYVLSPESLASKYCRDEYAEARNLSKQIVPIRLQPNIELPDALQRIQYADFSTRRFEDALADLIGDLGRMELQAKAQEAPPPVQKQQAISPTSQEQLDNFEAFREAVEARQTDDHETALRLLNTLAQTAPDFLPDQVAGLIQHSQAALERQARHKEYDRLYKQVSLLTLDPLTVEDARQMWEELQKDFPEIDDDLDGLRVVFQRKTRPEAETQKINPLWILAGIIGAGLLVGVLALTGVFGRRGVPAEGATEQPVLTGGEEEAAGEKLEEEEPTEEESVVEEEPMEPTYDRPIAVGSKYFTEQLILGSMTVQLLEANGYEVNDQTGLGSTMEIREALEAGEIDVYWEYTGTALVNILGVEDMITDPQEAYDRAKEADAANGLVWLVPAAFNDTYTLMVTQGTVDAGITTISDLAAAMQDDPTSFRLCTNAEFYARPDGFRGVEQLYGFAFPEDGVITMDGGLTYEALRNGECEVAMGFATDGRIAAFNFTNLEDDLGFFPTYNPAPVIRQEVLDADMGIGVVLNCLGPTLDTATMTELNKRVDIDGEDVHAVACDHLLKNGLVDSCG